ncbi:MAG: M23 family metallopeptidase [Oscillospiraceae bacterium]
MLRKKTIRKKRHNRYNRVDSVFLTAVTQSVLMFLMAVIFFISTVQLDNKGLKMVLNGEDKLSAAAALIKDEKSDSENFMDKVLGEAIFTSAGALPVSGSITSDFGVRENPVLGGMELHSGIDIGAAYGSRVVAAFPAICEKVGVSSVYGNYVILDHGNFKTKYCHLSSTPISQSIRLRAGELVGFVGDSGIATGPHLHFEIIKNEKYINPNSAFEVYPL